MEGNWQCACGYVAPDALDFCPDCWADRATGDRTWAGLTQMDFRPGGQQKKAPVQPHPTLSALQCALIAWGLSRYRRRHQFKEAGSRRGVLVRRHRIKDLSASGVAIKEAKQWIRIARATGWRGSIRQAVMEAEHAQ